MTRPYPLPTPTIPMRLGTGIFMWDGPERRSGRYGVVYLSDTTFDETTAVAVALDAAAIRQLDGRRARLRAVVLETRPSGHVGDAFWKIRPTTPARGAVLDLGVGTFRAVDRRDAGAGAPIGFMLAPGDGRAECWFDPLVLYQLHDQTVAIEAEPTIEPDSPPSPLLAGARPPAGAALVDAPDGPWMQLRGPEYLDPAIAGALLPQDVACVPVGQPGDGLFTLSVRPREPEPGEILTGVRPATAEDLRRAAESPLGRLLQAPANEGVESVGGDRPRLDDPEGAA